MDMVYVPGRFDHDSSPIVEGPHEPLCCCLLLRCSIWWIGGIYPISPSVVVMLLDAAGTSIVSFEFTFFSSLIPFIIFNGNFPFDSTSIDLSSDPTPINLSPVFWSYTNQPVQVFNLTPGSLSTREFTNRTRAFDKFCRIEEQKALIFEEKCRYDIISGSGFVTKAGIYIKCSNGAMSWFENTLSMRELWKLDNKEYVAIADIINIDKEDDDVLEKNSYAATSIWEAKYEKEDMNNVAKEQSILLFRRTDCRT